MKTILSYIEFITGCVNAISKGFKTAADSWPTNNPFGAGSAGATAVKQEANGNSSAGLHSGN